MGEDYYAWDQEEIEEEDRQDRAALARRQRRASRERRPATGVCRHAWPDAECPICRYGHGLEANPDMSSHCEHDIARDRHCNACEDALDAARGYDNPYRDPDYVRMVGDMHRSFAAAQADEAIRALGYNPYQPEGYCQKCGISCGGNICERCRELARGRI